MERAYVLSRSDTLSPEDLPAEIASQWLSLENGSGIPRGSTLKSILQSVESSVLAQHLQEDRTLQEIADSLGIDISTLVRKIKKYHLPKRYKRGD